MPSFLSVVKVPVEDHTQLETLLERRLPKSGMLYNVMKLTRTLDESSKIAVTFYADESQEHWSADTTTFMGVINVKGLPRSLIVFSGPAQGSKEESVSYILSVLDWSRELQFEGVDNSIAPTLIEEARKHGEVNPHDPIGLFYMTKEEALNAITEKDKKLIANSNIVASSLRSCDAALVQDRWPEKVQGYLDMLQASIELCSSGGVYLQNESVGDSKIGRLVSFAVALPFGSIHAFHTEPDQRRKGFGKIVMKILAQNISTAGRVPLVQIFNDNDNSRSLNEGVGFKYSHEINLITFSPK